MSRSRSPPGRSPTRRSPPRRFRDDDGDDRIDRDRRGRNDREPRRGRGPSRERRRSRDRDYSRGQGDSPDRRRPRLVDDFGREISPSRRRSISPERGRGRVRDRGEGGGDRDREMELRRRERERLKEWGREIDETEQPSGPGELGDGPLQLNMADMDEMEMMKAMGLPVDFQTTKGKEVEGNVEGFAKIKPNRKGRQYMNRVGGFNRSLEGEQTRTFKWKAKKKPSKPLLK